MASKNSFGAGAALRVRDNSYEIFRLAQLQESGVGNISRLPFSTKILLENLLRHEDGRKVSEQDVDYVARGVSGPDAHEISFMPARVLLQDFTDRKSTRLNSSHSQISYAVFCLKKKK